MTRRIFTFAAAGLLAAGLGVCTFSTVRSYAAPAPRTLADAPVAHAIIQGAGNDKAKIHGTVTFTQEGDGVHVTAHIMGLSPGKHGFHIHEKPDLSAPDLASAGGHWNPDHHKHGAPKEGEHHAGDLGNIEANDEGHAMYEETIKGISVNGHNPVVGHSVIIHEKADDLKSQPAGDAGKRVAGGVIETGSAEHHD